METGINTDLRRKVEEMKNSLGFATLKIVELDESVKAHNERIDRVEGRAYNNNARIASVEVRLQAGLQDVLDKLAAGLSNQKTLLENLSLRIERISHRLEAHMVKSGVVRNAPPDTDETDL